MSKLFLKLSISLLTISSLFMLTTAPAIAAGKPVAASSPIGNDISWPQCNKTLPTGQAFGIVGVNNGLANNTNPCLASQLAWAAKSSGTTKQPKVQLYVNTANPGSAGSWWPTSNSYGGTEVSSPYGPCNAGDYGAACAYMYGYAKAYDDVNVRGISNPTSYIWWLDVETINSWQTDKVANRADLEGMTAYFKNIGASVGLYSTSYQWGQIVGTTPETSNLNNLLSWIPGARNESAAKSSCSLAPLTAGSPVVLTQYVSGNLDYDYSCI